MFYACGGPTGITQGRFERLKDEIKPNGRCFNMSALNKMVDSAMYHLLTGMVLTIVSPAVTNVSICRDVHDCIYL